MDKGFHLSWSGMANQWECDEVGHLNMRHYPGKAAQARQMFLMELGLSHAFKAGVPSTVRVDGFHIRYMNEARPGAQLRIETGLVGFRETDLDLVHMIRHADGRIAAVMSETVSHIYRRTGEAFKWPSRVRQTAQGRLTQRPDTARPRGFPADLPMTGPDITQLIEWGCDHVGTGVFTPEEADIFNAVHPHAYIGRQSDSVGLFTKGWPDFDLSGWEGAEVMGVMLELKIKIHRQAAPGDPYRIYSGVVGADKNVRRMIHQFVNPFTGKSYASIIAVNGLIHMTERRLVRPSADIFAALKAASIPGLHG